jgi:oligopeptide transport system ATP-binding protein
MTTDAPLLEVTGLKKHFPITRGVLFQRTVGWVRAVDGVDFAIRKGETLGLVGESGCGKSTTARVVLQLYRPTAGRIRFAGNELTELDGEALRRTRRDLQLIYQDPYASLDPRMTVAAIVEEPLRNFGIGSRAERQERVAALMERVGLSPNLVTRYPHEFSGGQRQRIGIARALALEPKLIFADEPVSALDVSIQAQVLNLLLDLREQLDLTYCLIAHNLAVVRHFSDRVAVMYLGRIVEIADAAAIYREPLHPYTRALLSAIPIPDPEVERTRKRVILSGDLPSPDREYAGCRFASRCPEKLPPCEGHDPPLVEAAPGHQVACWLHPGARGRPWEAAPPAPARG